MQKIHFYAANLYSLDCEKSAELYARLFSLRIISISKNHSELSSESGFVIFIDRPSAFCNVSPGSISFAVPSLNLSELNLEPLQIETYREKERYASFLDEYTNRIWVFEKKNVTT